MTDVTITGDGFDFGTEYWLQNDRKQTAEQ